MRIPNVSLPEKASYSVTKGASAALGALLDKCRTELPQGALDNINLDEVEFITSLGEGDAVLFPCPLKQQDAVGAIKALEACMAKALAQLQDSDRQGCISVDMMKVACFISSAYITTVNSYSKADGEVRRYLPGKLSHQKHL